MRRAELEQLPAPPIWRVPRLWPGETCVILGGGPSLKADDVAYCRGRARVIAIKEAYRLAPWADLCYGAADKEWKRVNGAPDFAGLKVSVDVIAAQRFPGVLWLGVEMQKPGLSFDPTRLHAGSPGTPHSGVQAINLAVLLGAVRILLLGYDLKPATDGALHWFPAAERPEQRKLPFETMVLPFTSMPRDLAKAGCEVVNCTPGSALNVFPQAELREALP